MKAIILAFLFALTIPAHAEQTPFAWAHTATGGFIVLLKERCEFLTNMHQYIIVDLDHRILGGGCWSWHLGEDWVIAREGRTLHPLRWPVSNFNQWRDLSK